MISIPDFDIIEKIYEGSNVIIFRAKRNADELFVVAKLLKSDYPTGGELNRLRHEYETLCLLANAKSVINAYSLLEHGNSLLLVLEDIGGLSLKEYVRNRDLSLEEFLPIAIGMATCLQEIHSTGIIHQDINPSNFIYNPSTGQLRVIDFGIASALTREGVSLAASGQIDGTLAYISPEQTGRMNRRVDWRTDFYSLGITFYEMLTGKRPFDGSDPLELVHSHIARRPLPPHEINPWIPEIISSIIMKLLAKNAEDRYQSAVGMRADLQRCMERLKETGSIDSFPIGLKDMPERFSLPAKLYGREAEMAMLLVSLERVSAGRKEMVLVAGAPGIGKTALIREMSRHIAQRKGRFISSKFDQFVHDNPYSAIIGAFRELVNMLLAEPEESLAVWREKIREALGSNGQVMIDLIPELELIIGPQPPLAVLKSEAAENRLKIIFYEFIALFCRKEYPLVIFLDDVQWADFLSLGLIETIMSITEGSLMLICAYRDSEVDKAHPFTGIIKKIPEEFISRLDLVPLDTNYVADIVSDIVQRNRREVEALSSLVQQKTGGNPFFVGQFLKTLNSENLLVFDIEKFKWHWDMEQIRAKGFTDNVVELVMENIGRLQHGTQLLLKYASMMGNVFDLEKLSIISEISHEDVIRHINDAAREGFIIPLSGNDFAFSHDRIKQGAYVLIKEENRSAEHLRAGRLLLEGIPEDKRDENIFWIINQLNKGKDLISSKEERTRIAILNHQAGLKAKESAAFAPAYQLLRTGIDLIGQDSWQSLYEFTLAIHTDAAEVAYLAADHDEVERLGVIILKNARNLIDKVPFYVTRINSLTSLGRFKEALDTGLDTLDALDFKVPRKPTKRHVILAFLRVEAALRMTSLDNIVNFPETKDPRLLAIFKLMDSMRVSSYISFMEMIAIFTFESICLLIKNKCLYRDGWFPFITYSELFLIGIMGNIKRGNQLRKIAELLADRLDAKLSESVIHFGRGCFALHRIDHLRTTFPSLMQCYRVGLEYGNIEFASFGVAFLSMYMFMAGVELQEIDKDFRTYTPLVARLKQERVLTAYQFFHQVVLNLRGLSHAPCIISGETYRSEEMLPVHQENNDTGMLFDLYFCQMFLNYLFGHNEEALKNAVSAYRHIEIARGQVYFSFFHFYDSLVHLNAMDNKPVAEQHAIFRRIDRNQRVLKTWDKHAPMNYRHKILLVEAERARIMGRINAAMDYYDQAIKLACENKYLHEEAIANELAGRFYLFQDKPKLAAAYLKEARYLYERWGAAAKVKDLDERYSSLLSRKPVSEKDVVGTGTGTGTGTSTTESGLDVMSVLKASRVLSGEMVLDKLLAQLMRIAMENAGAQRGFLILNDSGRLTIEVEGSLDAVDTPILKSIDVGSGFLVSSAIIYYVERTKETVVLNNACEKGQFINDEYVKKNKPRSVLCMPIVNKGNLTGIFYLENNIAVGAFVPEQVKVLEMFASQAAISIENAKLYFKLSESEKKYRMVSDNITDVIWLADINTLRLTFVSPSIRNLFGYDAEEELTIFDFILEKDLQLVLQTIEKKIEEIKGGAFDTMTPNSMLIELRRRDGSSFWAEVNTRILLDEEDKPTALFGVTRDMSERMAKEEERRKRQAAEAASEAKGEFLAKMSHEIRTPMNAIIGFSELVSRTELNPRQSDYINKIKHSAKGLLKIINDILDFSKIEAGKLDIDATTFLLNKVIFSVSSLVSIPASEKGIEFNCLISDDIPNSLTGDPLRLGQILGNLASNAVKFTNAGHVLLKAELVDKGPDSCIIKFTVQDTGIGMTPEQMAVIFDAFSQADFSITRQYGGTGLGLTISNQLLKMMGSELRVASEMGRGSTFSFEMEFPYSRQDEHVFSAQEIQEHKKLIIDENVKRRISGTHVLLAEDNALNQEIAVEILHGAGILVDIAHNGKEAVEKATSSEYDLVFMDLEMPVMSGYEATKLIRSSSNRESLPVIAMTAHAMEGVRGQCLEAGMNDYVSKPIEMDSLLSKIAEWVKDSPSGEEKFPAVQAPAAPDTIPGTDFPAILPGIDVASGLKRLMGRTSLYKKVLTDFFRMYSSVADEIRQALEAGDMEFVRVKVHTIKGTAATLSAGEIYRTALELENAITEKTGDYAELIGNLERAFEIGPEVISILGEKAAVIEASADTPLDIDKVASHLIKLHHLVERDNPDAEIFLNSLKECVGNLAFRSEMQELEKCISGFDFENAKSPLHKIAAALNISLREN